MPLCHEAVTEMGPEEAGPAGYKYSFSLMIHEIILFYP
jgi:hypothetical protein